MVVSMDKPKYVLHPGEIVSSNDGDIHYVDASSLAYLYGVALWECWVVHYDKPDTWLGKNFEGMTHLYPAKNYERG